MSFSLHRLPKVPAAPGRGDDPRADPTPRRQRAEGGLLWPLGDFLAIWRWHGVLMMGRGAQLGSQGSGYFHHETRFLSHAELKVDGRKIQSASAAVCGPDSLTARFLAHPGQPKPDPDGRVPQPSLEIELQCRLGRQLALAYRFVNRSPAPIAARLEWRIDADFIDQGGVESGRRRPRVQVERHWQAPDGLLLRSLHPKLRHATQVHLAGPSPFHWRQGEVHCALELDAQEEARIDIEITPLFDQAYAAELASIDNPIAPGRWRDGCSRLSVANAAVQQAWDTAAADLEALQLGDGQGDEPFTPAAGVPHYLGLFGRDTLMTGWQTGLLNPSILTGSLQLVGRWTADAIDPAHDAQPGRVLHQRELGPMALLGRNPFLRYFGDHSASALYLLGVASAYARSGDKERFAACRDPALRTLEWMDRFGDRDGDGLYEYATTARKGGLKNQGWKDSNEAIVYPDGRIVPDPIVVCEVQALFAAAKQAMASAFRAAGDAALADDLAGQAAEARQRFLQTLWMEDKGFVALGLDPEKGQIRSLASNGGECLAYGVLDHGQAQRVADRIMQPDFFSGWGVRTLCAAHPAYNPLGYHLGSVWPCFSALVARGFARYGFDAHLHALAGALFDAAGLFEQHRLPELFGGHARGDTDARPGLYPNACWPQAWSAGAIVLLVDTLLGLRPAAPLGAVLIEPRLPEWLDRVALRDVRLGKGRLDLEVRRRAGGEMVCEVRANTTGLRLHGPDLAEPSAAEAEAVRAHAYSLP